MHSSRDNERAKGAMRIMLVTEASSAGVGRHVMDLTLGLVASGHSVHLAYARERVDARFDRQLAEWNSSAVTVVPMRRSPHWRDIPAAKKIRSVIRDHGPFDVVHAHSTKAGLITKLLPRKEAPAWVFTAHCPFSMRPGLSWPARTGIRTLERAILRRADRVIAVSAEEAEHLRALCPSSKIEVVLNGIQTAQTGARTEASVKSRAEARREAGIPLDGPLIGFVGRLSSQKDPAMLLAAMVQVIGKLPTARLAIAGWGPLEQELRQAATTLGLDDRVHWLGYVEGETVLPAFDVFAMPSRYEGMPYVLLEAMAAGQPIVTTDVGGARHAVEHKLSGFVCPVGDANRFAESLVAVLKDPNVRDQMSAVAHARSRHFSVDRMVGETVAVYRQALQHIGAATPASPAPASPTPNSDPRLGAQR